MQTDKSEKTCSDYIELILKREQGYRWRNKQIELAIAREFGVCYQNNTIAKYLSFLINKGLVQSAPVKLQSGKMCDEYWWTKKNDKGKETNIIPIKIDYDLATLKERCLEIAKTYPTEHPQYEAIMNQVNNVELRQRRTA